MSQHNEPDIFAKFAKWLLTRIEKCTSISGVIELMSDPFMRTMLNDLPEEQRAVLRRFAKDRCYALGWPRKVNDTGEEDQRPPEEIEESRS